MNENLEFSLCPSGDTGPTHALFKIDSTICPLEFETYYRLNSLIIVIVKRFSVAACSNWTFERLIYQSDYH